MKYLLVMLMPALAFLGFATNNHGYATANNSSPIDSTGYKLWWKYCVSCHAVNNAIVGPALGPVTMIRDKEWMIQYVKDSKVLTMAADSTALALRSTWRAGEHPKFDTLLTDKEIGKILEFVKVSVSKL